MAFSLFHPLRQALARVFPPRAPGDPPRADILTARVASSPAFLFQIHHSVPLGRHAVATACGTVGGIFVFAVQRRMLKL